MIWRTPLRARRIWSGSPTALPQSCTPGCNRPASKADLDHAVEYDHADPSAGGQTSPCGLVALCRFLHLITTFSAFLIDLFVGTDGRVRTTVTTPENLTVDGPVHTGDDLHPGLTDIEFTEPPTAPPGPDDEHEPPDAAHAWRTNTPTDAKNANATDNAAKTPSTTNPNHRSERE